MNGAIIQCYKHLLQSDWTIESLIALIDLIYINFLINTKNNENILEGTKGELVVLARRDHIDPM